VISIAGILQVLHKTDVEEKFQKGDYYRKAQNHPEECFSQGQKYRISGSRIFHEFLALRNLAKSFTKRCGATLYKGAKNSGLAEFPWAGNSIISGAQKFG
jgi:hypothetical protein